MLKKSFLLVMCLSVVGAVSIAHAAEFIKAMLFPVQLTVNQKEFRPAKGEYRILNVEDDAYVPIRPFVERNGGRIDYDGDSQRIDVYWKNAEEHIAGISNKSSNDNFMLSVHSAKAVYKEGETVDIWGTFHYMKDEDITIYHSYPLIKFTIVDQDGLAIRSAQQDVLSRRPVSPAFEMVRIMPFYEIENYHIIKYGDDEYLKLKKPWLLAPGEYTIGVLSEYDYTDAVNKDPVKQRLETTISITVLPES